MKPTIEEICERYGFADAFILTPQARLSFYYKAYDRQGNTVIIYLGEEWIQIYKESELIEIKHW